MSDSVGIVDVVGVVGWLAVAPILEWRHARWARQTPQTTPTEPDGAPAPVSAPLHPLLRIGWRIARVVLSMVLGFYAGVVLDVVYEETIAPPGTDIEFGDPASYVFIVVGTAIAWLILWQLGRWVARLRAS